MTAVILDDGTVAEAEIQPKGQPKLLMQFLMHENGDVGITGDAGGSSKDFIADVKNVLGDRIDAVRKGTSRSNQQYTIETMSWDGSTYVRQGVATATRPPKHCIWLEPLSIGRPATAQLSPRFYQRTAGQLVLRASNEHEIASLLGRVRRAAHASVLPETHNFRDVPNPIVQSSLSIDIDHYRRTFAKIGMNLLIYMYGESYARHHAFNRTKGAILHGKPMPTIRQLGEFPILESVPSDRHVLMLAFMKTKAGRYGIGAFIRLYGGKTMLVGLSQNAPEPPIKDPVAMVVHYNRHHIELLNVEAFARAYKQDVPQDFRDAATKEHIYELWPTLNPRRRH
ncbi:hypothetical protein [Cupriavidus basilensis]|uniref:hypothetical protein n=1 Tax=Cupriavidus basilensis TaxID=68895 RepID=UPI0020A63225|nr:hypothetical protein [Cupriavidus basilensis]MCP3022288.1 hypothetical protein [Cupriavidus basilensis]